VSDAAAVFGLATLALALGLILLVATVVVL